MKCSVEDCPKESYCKGLCSLHYKRMWRHGDTSITHKVITTIGCKVEGCENKHEGLGLCKIHYLRFTRYGRYNKIVNRGSGFTLTSNGYIVVTTPEGRQYEHILVAEKALGKKLPKGAIVHHVDENGFNNEPTNLVVCPDQAYHLLLHRRAKELGYA